MTSELWYWEQCTLGRWWPRTAPEAPSGRSSEGFRPVMRGLIKVDPGHHKLSLKALREIYSVDGHLVGSQGPDHYRAVMGIRA